MVADKFPHLTDRLAPKPEPPAMPEPAGGNVEAEALLFRIAQLERDVKLLLRVAGLLPK